MNAPDTDDVEEAGRKHCDWILTSAAAQRCGEDGENLVLLAFTMGACWALDLYQFIELAREQHAARLGTKQ